MPETSHGNDILNSRPSLLNSMTSDWLWMAKGITGSYNLPAHDLFELGGGSLIERTAHASTARDGSLIEPTADADVNDTPDADIKK